MSIKKLEKRIEKQQEQIDMLIELANNMTEQFASDQKVIKNHNKVNKNHSKTIKSLIHNSEINRNRLDEIKNFFNMVHLELLETDNNNIIN